MRASDALEKLSATHANWIDPYAQEILSVASKRDEQEIRWHAAQILPRLALTPRQRELAIDLLFGFLKDQSRILQRWAFHRLRRARVG